MKKLKMLSVLLLILTITMIGCSVENSSEKSDQEDTNEKIVNIGYNSAYANKSMSYTMNYYGLNIAMEYDSESDCFICQIFNLTSASKTIKKLCAQYENGLCSESINDIVIESSETYTILEGMDNSEDFSNWQPYIEIIMNNKNDTVNLPSILLGN